MESRETSTESFVDRRVKSIQGLRGIAVLLVVLSHSEFPLLKNGFVGVDIFFVISGFLITQGMVKEYLSNRSATNRQGWISFVNFYSRRARKILPAAFVVIVLVFLLDIWTPLFGNGVAVKNDAYWAFFFLANLNFMNQSATYFGVPATQSPLLHFWSLSVEEQFYLVWPLFFMTIVSINGFKLLGISFNWKKRLYGALSILVSISVIIYYYQLVYDNTSGYYSSIGRFWEFGLGALFALIRKKEISPTLLKLKVPAFICFLIAFFLLDSSRFQYFIVIAVLLTSIFLHQSTSGNGKIRESLLLENRFLLYFGKISYSLYLVHLPLIILLTNSGFKPSGLNFLIFFPLVVLLGAFLFKEVESRFLKIKIPEVSKRSAARRTRYFPLNKDGLRYSCAAVGVLVFAANFQVGSDVPLVSSLFKPKAVEPWTPPQNYPGLANQTLIPATSNLGESRTTLIDDWNKTLVSSFQLSKLPDGISPAPSQLDAERLASWGSCLTITRNKPACNSGSEQEKNKVFIYGDSYALSLSPMIFGSLSSQNYNIVSRIYGQCMIPAMPTESTNVNKICDAHRANMYSEVNKTRPRLIIASSLNSAPVIGRKSDLYTAMVSAYKVLVENAQQVVVVGEIPFGADPRTCVASDKGLSRCLGSLQSRQEYRELTEKAAKEAGAKYIDITKWICISGRCPAVIDGVISTYDGGHMTISLSKKLAPLFLDQLKQNGIML